MKKLPRIYIAHLLPPPLGMRARLMPQHMHWQVGRYREVLRAGPGGLGKGRIWIPELEGEQHNLILNQAYDTLMATHGITSLMGYAVVGTGSTAPSASDVGLVNERARTNSSPGGDSITQPSNGLFEFTYVREFTEAQVGGQNLTEWGFSPSATAGNNLAVRELFRDGGGNPVTLTLAADQKLRLIYKYRLQVAPVTAVAHTIDIAGLGMRTGLAVHTMSTGGSGGTYPPLVVTELAMTGNVVNSGGGPSVSYRNMYLHAIAGSTSYTDTNVNTSTLGNKWPGVAAYTANSRQRQVNPVTFLNTEANGTIRTIGLGPHWLGGFRFVLDSGQEIIKDNLNKLTIGAWTLTWGP